jgi:excisionase family DNA binding protein
VCLKVYTTKEAGAVLGISQRTLFRYIAELKLAVLRTGPHQALRITQRAIDHYIERHERYDDGQPVTVQVNPHARALNRRRDQSKSSTTLQGVHVPAHSVG